MTSISNVIQDQLFSTESKAQGAPDEQQQQNNEEYQENPEQNEQLQQETNEEQPQEPQQEEGNNQDQNDYQQEQQPQDGQENQNEQNNEQQENYENQENEQQQQENYENQENEQEQQENYNENENNYNENIETQNDQYENENQEYQPQPPSQPSNTMNSRRSPRTRQRPPVDEAAVDAVCTCCINGTAVTETDPNTIAAAVVELENQRNDLMAEGHIRESLEHQKAVDRAKDALTTAQKKQAQSEYQATLQEKKRQNERQTKELYAQIDRAEQEFTEKSKESMERLQKQQQNELDQYDAEWQSESKIRQFNRISGRLRALRHQQDLLLAAKRFDEADQVMRIADQQEKIETQQSSKAMLDAFLAGRKKLEQKHENERINLMSSLDGKRQEMRACYAQQKLACENRAKVLESEERLARDPEHVWIMSHRNEESLTTIHRQAAGKPSLMTRTLAPKPYGTLSLPPLQIPNKTAKKN